MKAPAKFRCDLRLGILPPSVRRAVLVRKLKHAANARGDQLHIVRKPFQTADEINLKLSGAEQECALRSHMIIELLWRGLLDSVKDLR